MPTRDELTWYRCKDFSKGIVKDNSYGQTTVGAGFAPDGSAQVATGCLPSPTGAILPGWHKATSVAAEAPGYANYTSGYRPADSTGKTFLVGSAVLPAVMGNAGLTLSNRSDAYPDVVFQQYLTWYAPGNNGNYVPTRHWKIYYPSGPNTLNTGTFSDASVGTTTGSDYRRVFGYMASGYAGLINGANWVTNPPVTDNNPYWFVVSNTGPSYNDKNRVIWPDPDTSRYGGAMANIAIPIAGSLASDVGDVACYHQGRLVIGQSPFDFTGSAANSIQTSILRSYPAYYTGVFEMAMSSAGPALVMNRLFLQDSATSKISAMLSVNASNLFIQTDSSGAYSIAGDLDRPQVSHLPSIPSAHGRATIPVATTKGVIFTSRSGAYAWGQGQDAQLLSTQLPGTFFQTSNNWDAQRTQGATKGKLNYIDPWVMFPNDYVLDLRTNGFWQIQRPASTQPFFHYEVGATGIIYAMPEHYTQSETQWVSYDTKTQARNGETWDWKSTPVADLSGAARDAVFRQAEVVVSGSGTLALTVTAGANTFTATTLTLDESVPTRVQLDLSLHTRTTTQSRANNSVTYSFHAVGNSDTKPAPAVHEIGLAYRVAASG